MVCEQQDPLRRCDKWKWTWEQLCHTRRHGAERHTRRARAVIRGVGHQPVVPSSSSSSSSSTAFSRYYLFASGNKLSIDAAGNRTTCLSDGKSIIIEYKSGPTAEVHHYENRDYVVMRDGTKTTTYKDGKVVVQKDGVKTVTSVRSAAAVW